ncbi:MAG: DUF1842 domain-containing protein [Clostridia bacterium]|nr:DUF1842 domain-containing protein [Clostridia bacterium]
MKAELEKATGLFIVGYEIGGDIPGAPLFKIHFSVYPPEEKVDGMGLITQATNPPLDVATNIHGHYTYMCIMPNVCHILVTATGYPIVKWPVGGGVGPIIQPNTELRMVLSEDWKSGTANYKYLDAQGQWHEITNAPVKLIKPEMPNFIQI